MRKAGGSGVAAPGWRFAMPRLSPGLALNPRVLERLSAPDVSVGVVTAPAGYGKTSHAAAWVRLDGRAAAWIDVEDQHDDPVILLGDLMDALGAVTDFVGGDVVAGGAGPDQYATTVAAALGRALRRCERRFVLVLDDVHRLTVPFALDLVDAVISNVPDGSMVLLVGRAFRSGTLPRLRVGSHVVEIGVDDLALDAAGAAQVLAEMGVDAGGDDVQRVIGATEGWPVGVRLAGLATLADVPQQVPSPSVLNGREADVHEYLDAEWLWDLGDADRDFLVRLSVLDWLSGPLCNEVLGRHDAGDVLHRIASDRHLVIPLDRREGAYRMHGLLRDALQAEFERLDEGAVRDVHRRASSWFETAGDIDRAVRHAAAAADFVRAERLVVDHAPSYYTNGHYATINRWVESIPRDRVVRSPALCLCAALAVLGAGDAATLNVWLQLGERASASASEADRIARLCLLDLRSTTNTGPVRPALAAAATAYQGLPPGIWHAASCLAYGVWSWAVGDDIAAKLLSEGAAEAAVFGATTLEAHCTAMLAMITYSDGDAARAWSLAARARQLAIDHGLERAAGMAVVTALSALAAASTGEPTVATAEWHLARSQLAQLKDLSGWANVQTRVALAHTSLLLGDRIGAETMLREAHEFLIRQPDATRAQRQVAEMDDLLRHARRHTAIGSSALTTAELRVLHFLPTNLTLAEISTRLFVSRYTVKTHCESIYRKLNVNSRSEAVESARCIGLLDDAMPTDVV